MKEIRTKYNIVFAVCHPDDESIWVGGLIGDLLKFGFIDIYVIVLSGGDPNSPRVSEFNRAMQIVGVSKAIVLGGALRPALEPLPDLGKVLEEGLNRLNLPINELSILITHSPYGDEHPHPHHQQAYFQLFQWAKNQKVPFGYFSAIPIPLFKLYPLQRSFKRKNELHLLNLSRCYFINPFSIKNYHMITRKFLKCPRYFIQFETDQGLKKKMLNCYHSVDLSLFYEGYAMFSSRCAILYIFDEKGMLPFNEIVGNMPSPGPENLFENLGQTCTGLLKKGFNRIIRFTKETYANYSKTKD